MDTRFLESLVGQRSGRTLRTLVLLVAIVFGGVSLASAAPGMLDRAPGPAATDQAWMMRNRELNGAQAQPIASECDLEAPALDAEPWARTELFFGTAKPDGTAVTDAEWRAFLDTEITERFPDGLTVLTGIGQYRAGEQIVQERSLLLILLYPREALTDSHKKIEAIRAAYEKQFDQSSVLRADDSLPVCTSF